MSSGAREFGREEDAYINNRLKGSINHQRVVESGVDDVEQRRRRHRRGRSSLCSLRLLTSSHDVDGEKVEAVYNFHHHQRKSSRSSKGAIWRVRSTISARVLRAVHNSHHCQRHPPPRISTGARHHTVPARRRPRMRLVPADAAALSIPQG